jgi:RNase P subunit RPR2
MTFRCEQCGNKTRFDVYEVVRRRRFEHYTLSGEMVVEEDEVLDREIEKVVCRWCEAVLTVGGDESTG